MPSKHQPAPPPAKHNPVPADWVPEFPGQRPPFAEGNTLAVKYGAGSPRIVNPIAQELITEVLSTPATAYLAEPRYAPALLAWATAEAKTQLISDWVDRMDLTAAASSERGQTSPLELLRKWSTTAMNHRQRLGLDPLSAARLGKDVAVGQAADAAVELTRQRDLLERTIKGEAEG